MSDTKSNLTNLMMALAENHAMMHNQLQALSIMSNNSAPLLRALSSIIQTEVVFNQPAGGDHHANEAKGPNPADSLATVSQAVQEAGELRSRIGQIADQFRQAAAVAPQGAQPLPVPVQQNQPTPVAAAGVSVHAAGPTPVEQKPELSAAEVASNSRKAELLDKLVGPRSVFVQLLSPKVIQGGRGFCAPVVLTQYQEDIYFATNAATWPTGFYTSSVNGETQMYINATNVAVIVSDLPSPEAKLNIRFKTSNNNAPTVTDLASISNDQLENVVNEMVSTLRKHQAA